MGLQITAESREWVCSSKRNWEFVPQFGGQQSKASRTSGSLSCVFSFFLSERRNPFQTERIPLSPVDSRVPDICSDFTPGSRCGWEPATWLNCNCTEGNGTVDLCIATLIKQNHYLFRFRKGAGGGEKPRENKMYQSRTAWLWGVGNRTKKAATELHYRT